MPSIRSRSHNWRLIDDASRVSWRRERLSAPPTPSRAIFQRAMTVSAMFSGICSLRQLVKEFFLFQNEIESMEYASQVAFEGALLTGSSCIAA